MKIISERHKEYGKAWELEFYLVENNEVCFAFPCDMSGDVIDLNPAAQENYERCLALPEKYYPHKHLLNWSWIEPAVGLCACGKEVALVSDYCGATQCECGQWYNVFGQALLPLDQWEDDYN